MKIKVLFKKKIIVLFGWGFELFVSIITWKKKKKGGKRWKSEIGFYCPQGTCVYVTYVKWHRRTISVITGWIFVLKSSLFSNYLWLLLQTKVPSLVKDECVKAVATFKKKNKKQIWVEAEGRNWPLSFLTVWMVLLLSHGFPKQRLEVRRRRQQMIVKRLSSAALVQGRDKMGADWVHCLDTQMTRRWLRKDEKEMH